MVECPVCAFSFGDMLLGDGAAMHDLMTHKLARTKLIRIDSVAKHNSNHTEELFFFDDVVPLLLETPRCL